MNILIIGCGDTGSRLANIFDRMGHEVSVVDRREDAANALDEDFSGLFTVGVPIDQDILRHAGIEGCDSVIAVTRDDNVNLMVAQVARDIFGVAQVISRVSDPHREEVFSSFGLNTVCPTNLTVDSVVSSLTKRITIDELNVGSSRISVERMEIDRRYLGEYAEAIPIPEGRTLFGVLSPNGKMRLRASEMKTKVADGDCLIVGKILGEGVR